MVRSRRRGLTLGLCVLLAATVGAGAQAQAQGAKPPAAAAKKPAPAATKMVLEPRAMELLKATAARLAAAKSMSFTGVASYEYPSQLGPPIQYTMRYDVTMQRPDKLRVIIPGDGPASEFYYDGKTMTAYAPVENLAAVVAAPPTIDAALQEAFQRADIYFPFTDLIVEDPYAAMADGAILAFYIGPSGIVGGAKTEMIAWANKDVFLQIWIGADDKLPRRVRAVYSADPLQLRHELDLSNWQIDPQIDPASFTSEKAKTAGVMKFDSPTHVATQPGLKPLGNPKSPKPAAAKPAAKSP